MSQEEHQRQERAHAERRRKLDELRRAIQSGSYDIDVDALANALLDSGVLQGSGADRASGLDVMGEDE